VQPYLSRRQAYKRSDPRTDSSRAQIGHTETPYLLDFLIFHGDRPKLDRMQNPSVVLRGPGQATIEDRPVPTITGDNDVLVRIAYTGVCGSDVSFLLSFTLPFYVFFFPGSISPATVYSGQVAPHDLFQLSNMRLIRCPFLVLGPFLASRRHPNSRV